MSHDGVASTAVPAVPGTAAIAYDDVPLSAFHVRVAAASTGGVFSDGFGLGIIGIALNVAVPRLHLTPLWLGLLGGASLSGLFLGALITGPFADHFGRRAIFAYNMLVLALLCILQFFVNSAGQLLVLRLLIGFLLGTDYVVSKALLTEFTPRAYRGRILGILSVAWAAGYACAYFGGFALTAAGDEPWRWILVTSAVPCLLILPMRLTMPETPLWLADHGHGQRAAAIVRARLGSHVAPPVAAPRQARGVGRWRQLASAQWRRRTLVGCTFFTCQVIPYFAVGTFVTRLLHALHVQGSYVGGVVYNLALLAGAGLGVAIVDRIPRRSFLVGSFTVAAAALLVLAFGDRLSTPVVVMLFAVFAGVVSAASNLVYVYLPELFPTDLRASGIGLAVAASRVGSAVSTFLLPLVVEEYGVRAAMGACVAVLGVGAVVCQAFAPETKHARLASAVD